MAEHDVKETRVVHPQDQNVRYILANPEPVYDIKPKADMSKRSLVTIVSGALGAIAGYVGSKLYINQKMFDFDTEVLDMTKKNILGRSGLGASIAEGGISMGSGGLAAGLGMGEIHMANATALAQSGKHGSFPKFIYKTLGGPEGKTMMALAGAAAAGTVTAAIAHSMAGPEKTYASQHPEPHEREGKDWAERVAVDKDQVRSLN